MVACALLIEHGERNLNLQLTYFQMASRGRGRKGCPRGVSQTPPVFDQQAFVEAVGVAVASIAQASAAGGQGGPINLQWFIAHHPPTFIGGGDLVVADHWFR